MFQEGGSQQRMAPIFNRRKRPREAMMTFPEGSEKLQHISQVKENSNTSTWPKHNSQSVPSISQIRGKSQPLFAPDASKQCYNMKPKPGSRVPQPTTSIKFGSGPPIPTQKESKRSDCSSVWGSGGNGQNTDLKRRNNDNIDQTGGLGQSKFGAVYPGGPQYKRPGQVKIEQSNKPDAYKQRSGGLPYGFKQTPKQGYDAFGQAALPRPNYDDKPSTAYKNQTPNPPESANMSTRTNIPRNTAQHIDKSLRVLTASVTDIKRCSLVNKACVSVLFELYGTVDSAMTSIGTCGRKFFIKDDTGRMDCIFHEIDRPLERLMRGICYRCVGSYDDRRQVLTCVLVRRAEDRETKLYESMRDLADKVISDLSLANSEM